MAKDQAVVISLLNKIKKTDGGRLESPFTAAPKQGVSVIGLYQAITEFQRRYPGLSVDGHVDPGGATLSKLVEIAAKTAVSSPVVGTPAPAAKGPIRSCALPPTSAFAAWPSELLNTLCRSYKGHVAGSVFLKTLPGAFEFGNEKEPLDFSYALTKGNAVFVKDVYDRFALYSGLWDFVDLIYHAWSGANKGFDFSTKGPDEKRSLIDFLDKSPYFARDTNYGQMLHQGSTSIGSKLLAPDHQCWREVIDGSPGLHICLSNTSYYDNSVHVDPTQIVKGKDSDGTCVYSYTTDLKHLWQERDILKKTIKDIF